MEPPDAPGPTAPEGARVEPPARAVPETAAEHLGALAADVAARAARSAGHVESVAARHARRLTAGWAALWRAAGALAAAPARGDPLLAAAALRDYLRDAGERALLTADTLREAATAAVAHEDGGLKPVLAFDYETIVEGRALPRPVNYALVRVLPPEGFPPTRPDLRPWVIIDPRSGQGSGIGGFKAESEVGIALAEGYPVYFVVFSQYPVPGQTLADITEAEAEFLRRIRERHPGAGRPFVTGNCQGGWATMILAATHPDLAGPIVIAGVPLSPWAGRAGQNPLRYLGGWVGGVLPAQLLADVGGGLFDGAALVANFEAMNPGRDLWRKYAELFAEIDTRAAAYLEFDRWWSGFYFMNAAEIRWIIENIFVGNRLARGLAVLDDGTRIDLSRVASPIVVFASHGDAVSTVQQALRWIPDVWGSAARIREAGRTIIYTTHDSATHLSLFVAADVADEHHRRIGSVLRTIEALPPGLYEMVVEERRNGAGPMVRFEARETDAILALCDNPARDDAFAQADALADWVTRGYDLMLGPWLRALATPPQARLARALHPLRLQNLLLSDANPAMAALAAPAARVRARRVPAPPGNPFQAAEHALIELVAAGFDLARDLREAATELGFLALYDHPLWRPRPAPTVQPARPALPEAPSADDLLARIERGGYAEAVVRMCVLLSRAGGQVRQDRIERFAAMLETRAPFSSMTPEMRRRLIDEQSRLVEQAGRAAEDALMRLLRDDTGRYRAVNLVHDVMELGPDSAPEILASFAALQRVLRTRARNWQDPPAAPPAG